jgi:tetratricopeptide (TPR) repeat protein
MKFRIILILTLFTSGLTFGQTANDFNVKAIDKSDEGNFKAALKEINNAIILDSLNTDFLNSKGYYLYELEQYQESYDVYSKAIAIEGNSHSYDGRGIVLETVGEFNLAIEDYSMAINKAENDTIKYMELSNRAAAKMKLRDFQSAYEDLMNAYSFDSSDIAVLTNLGAVCDEIGKGEETLKYLLKAIEVDPEFYPAYGNIGFKYQEMGQYSKAIEYCNKVLEFDPNEPLGYSNRSYNLYKLGDLKGAHKDIDKSIKLYPGNSYAYRIKALIYLEEGKLEKACVNIQIALNKGFTSQYGDEVINLKNENCKK